MEKIILNLIDETAPGVIDTALSSTIDSYGGFCDDCYLLVNRRELVESLNDSDHCILRERLIARLKTSSLKVIFYNIDESCYKTFVLAADGLISYNLSIEELSLVKSRDLSSIAEKYSDESFLTGSSQYHFSTPSHSHTNVFFRLGDSIKNRDDLDRVSFWLLDSIDKADYLFIDSWSIAAIPLRALQMLGKNTPFDALPAHPAKKAVDCAHLLSGKISNLRNAKNPLLIVSVVSSGALVTAFQKIFSDVVPGRELKFVSIFSFIEKPYSFCKLNYDVINYKFNECKFCESGSAVIEIHPSSYYIKDMRDSGVTITKDIVEGNFDFFSRYKSCIDEMLSFHRGDSTKNKKHYSYFIDFKVLSSQDSFKSIAIDKVKKSVLDGALIISLVRDNFINLIEEHKSVGVVVISTLEDLSDQSLIERVRQSSQLIVYDPVVINGDYFDTINRRIRENRAYDKSISNILFLTGLFRPSKPKDKNKIKNNIAYPQSGVVRAFNYIEFLVLPDGGERTCPWCFERRALESIVKPVMRRQGLYDERLSLLNNVERGLKGDEIFFHFDQSTKAVALGAESYIGPAGLSVAGVMLAVASAMQMLREHTDEKKRLAPKFPFTQVLGVGNFELYSECLIRVAIIRAASAIEFGIVEKEKVINLIKSQISGIDQKMLLAEYIVAILCGKFPADQFSDDILDSKIKDSHANYPEVLAVINS